MKMTSCRFLEAFRAIQGFSHGVQSAQKSACNKKLIKLDKILKQRNTDILINVWLLAFTWNLTLN